MLHRLTRQGYPLNPGGAGENVAVRGLNVNSLAVGTILRVSGGAILEITRTRPTCYVMDQIHHKLKKMPPGGMECMPKSSRKVSFTSGK